jgi:hypothetical protein
MKRTTKIALAVGAALSLGVAATVANAHGMGWGGGPGYGMGWGGGPGYGMGYGMHGYGMGPGYGPGAGGAPCYGPGPGYGPGARFGGYPGGVEDRLAAMKSELGITANQEGAWKSYADTVKKNAETRQAWFEKMREARSSGSAPEMLAQRAEIAKQRQAELESTAKVFKNLYASLSDEQKQIADQTLGGFGPGYGRGYGRGPRGR